SEITASKDEQGPPQGAPISIDITGRGEYSKIIAEAEKIKTYLEKQNVKGIEKLKMNVESDRPEIPITVNREQVRKLNASTSQVGNSIRAALLGQDISTYTEKEETY